MAVNLVIKSAAQTADDFEMQCELAWTIGQIKEKIAEEHPTKPKIENQKLIYGGKLLPNHLSLKSILNPSQDRHTIHLVCPAPEKSVSEETKQATPTPSFPVPPANSAFPPINQPFLNAQGFSGIPTVGTPSFMSGDPLQQYLALQQMRYEQFMAMYMSQFNGGMPMVFPNGAFMAPPSVQTPEVPAPQQNAPANPPARADPDADYLDYLYILTRAVMLFAILYYYSSINRVLVVVAMFLLISVYVKLNRQNQQEQQRRERQRQNTEQNQEPALVQQQATNQENASNGAPAEQTAASQPSEGRSFTSMVTLTVSLISSFFTSLIPADPMPVNIN